MILSVPFINLTNNFSTYNEKAAAMVQWVMGMKQFGGLIPCLLSPPVKVSLRKTLNLTLLTVDKCVFN